MAEGSSQLVRDDRRDPPATGGGGGLTVVVTSVASDAHTWNLVFLQLTLEELGHRVRNLGACVPDDLLVAECLRIRPDLVVVSSVNGHGFRDGTRLIGRIRACPELAATPVVIGGKLGIAGPGGDRSRDQLLAAGFDAVFEADAGIDALRSMTEQLTVIRQSPASQPAGLRTNYRKVDHQ
ncbi:MAG: methylaspartate mutase [Micromonosporaceae bacterium]|nr:methylaspartate mutase [Micromonosporaceae bacterium]